MYPEGDRTAQPSGRMPAGGFYFDAIVRQRHFDENQLDPADNLEEFLSITPEELAYYEVEANRLFTQTDKAILGNFGGTGFGDIALVPAIQLKDPRGIRDMEEWYMSTVTRRDYVWKVFEKQCEIGLENLQRIYERVGEKISVLYVSGADFGAQNGPFISPKAYRDLYQPFHKIINTWVHQHTGWKTFIHSCGSVVRLYPDFIEAGFDVFNPVQTSAAGMDPQTLADLFGDQITFWGGGVDTQHTLPFGTPEEIRDQVRQRMQIFGRGGGFVFNPIHNVQAGVPVENLIALYAAVDEFRAYPLQ
jgi:uroporphyrinogen-III decarboxylase